MSFPLAFSYISHKFTSTLGLQSGPRIVTCNQQHDYKDIIVNGISYATVDYVTSLVRKGVECRRAILWPRN